MQDVYVDSREVDKVIEKGQEIISRLKKKYMDCGDVVCGDVAIERKTLGDFSSSVLEQRVFRQAERMQDYNYRGYVFIVGDIEQLWMNPHIRKRFSLGQYTNAVSELAMQYNTPCISVRDETHFWEMANKFTKYANEPNTRKPHIKRKANKNDTLLSILCCIDGIGVKKATTIIRACSLRDLLDMSEKELREIDGIGKKHAKSLKAVFN